MDQDREVLGDGMDHKEDIGVKINEQTVKMVCLWVAGLQTLG